MQVESIAVLEHSAILLTCIKRLPILKTYFCLLFEWSLKMSLSVVLNP